MTPLCLSVVEIEPRYSLELDALQLEEEEEGPSYLADLNKAPDFIDEPPVEVAEVRLLSIYAFILLSLLSRHRPRKR